MLNNFNVEKNQCLVIFRRPLIDVFLKAKKTQEQKEQQLSLAIDRSDS